MFLQIMLLQGIWLPLNRYNYESTPFWAGVFILPLTLLFRILLSGRERFFDLFADIKIGRLGVYDRMDFSDIRFLVSYAHLVSMDLDNFSDIQHVAPAVDGFENGTFNIDRAFFCQRCSLQFAVEGCVDL